MKKYLIIFGLIVAANVYANEQHIYSQHLESWEGKTEKDTGMYTAVQEDGLQYTQVSNETVGSGSGDDVDSIDESDPSRDKDPEADEAPVKHN